MAQRRETVIYRYDGHCPECGESQSAGEEPQADRVCDKCLKRQADKVFRAKIDFLHNAKIIDFKTECHLNYDHSLNSCSITEMLVKTSDGRTINVTTHRGLWRAEEE